jgi:hypothetical protein
LLRVQDYHDEWTGQHLALLGKDFEAEPVAVSESIFADVPMSTLRTYGSWTDRFFLVKARRKAP